MILSIGNTINNKKYRKATKSKGNNLIIKINQSIRLNNSKPFKDREWIISSNNNNQIRIINNSLLSRKKMEVKNTEAKISRKI